MEVITEGLSKHGRCTALEGNAALPLWFLTMVEEQGTDTGINTFTPYTESREKVGVRRLFED